MEKKKVIMISDNFIFGYGGGAISERKYYVGIKEWCSKNNYEFLVISPDNNIHEKMKNISVKKNRLMDTLCRVFLHSTYMFFSLYFNKKKILKENPSIIFLGRSRLGFFAKYVKRHTRNCKVITSFENVEYDYVDCAYNKNNGLRNKIINILEKKIVYKDEIKSVKYSDGLVFLTSRDLKRTNFVYSSNEINNIKDIIPICLDHEQNLTIIRKEKSIVFIGSLNYSSNEMAVLNFLSNVWKPFFLNNNKIRFIIAGKSPTKKLVENVDKYDNVVLIDGFDKIENVIPKYSLLVAPIEKGAGMKVKVADALSMGLSILASEEALVGYEEAIKDDLLNSIELISSIKSCVDCITSYIEKDEEELSRIELENKRIFSRYYSYNRSNENLNNFINRINFNSEKNYDNS